MENPKVQLVESIQGANNVLVTVSSSPTVDQLSAAIGLTLLLNKMGKHATAVYSGSTPSAIEFLQPEKTLEKTTDSLRDFIIALDKTKADKLRYKVEEDHVKIFITPFRTSITEKDLEFSQGDFNVDVVVALGVKEQRDLDQVITAHGRILHDATTIALTTGEQTTLGSINWIDAGASSLCEMVASVAGDLQPGALDAQMATALMTGIVAETERFSNAKTSQGAMSASATLMAAGANQQLVASNLQDGASHSVPAPVEVPPAHSPDGSLQIAHPDNEVSFEGPSTELPEFVEPVDEPEPIDDEPESAIEGGSSLILEPPSLGGRLTANSEPEYLDPSVDPLAGGGQDTPLLSHDEPREETEPVNEEPLPDLNGTEDLPGPTMTLPSEAPLPPLDSNPPLPTLTTPEPAEEPAPPVPEPVLQPSAPVIPDFVPKTLSDIEEAVASPHLDDQAAPSQATLPGSADLAKATEEFQSPVIPEPTLDTARDAVMAAIAGDTMSPLPPIAAIGSQPLDLEIKQTGETGKLDHIDESTGMPVFTMPENLVPSNTELPADITAAPAGDPTAPPPVPPPMMPNFDLNNTLPDMPVQDQPSSPQNPFGLPPS